MLGQALIKLALQLYRYTYRDYDSDCDSEIRSQLLLNLTLTNPYKAATSPERNHERTTATAVARRKLDLFVLSAPFRRRMLTKRTHGALLWTIKALKTGHKILCWPSHESRTCRYPDAPRNVLKQEKPSRSEIGLPMCCHYSSSNLCARKPESPKLTKP